MRISIFQLSIVARKNRTGGIAYVGQYYIDFLTILDDPGN